MNPEVEAALALALARYPRSPDPDPIHADAAFWTRAGRGGVAVLLATAMDRWTPDLKAAARSQAAMGMRSKAVLARVLALLGAEGIEAVPLKGPALGERLYGQFHLRPTSDVDILVAPANLDRALDILKANGGVLEAPYQSNRESHERFNHHLGVAFLGMLVELHWKPSGQFDARFDTLALLARSTPAAIWGTTLRVLEPHDELLFLSVHAASHLLERDVLLLDLRRIFETRSPSWSTLEARARESRVHRVVAATWVAAHQRVGLSLEGMPARWRRLGEDRLRAAVWTWGVATAGDSWEALKTAVVGGAWADDPLRGAGGVGARLLFGARRRVREGLERHLLESQNRSRSDF